jgi:hypothetical protein
VFETTVPVAPIPFAFRIAVTLLAQHPVIVKKVCVKFISGVEAVFPVLKLDNTFRPDSVGEFEGLFVLLFVGSRLFGYQILIA